MSDGHASTQVSGGPWGGRVLPSVGGLLPPVQRHGEIREGWLPKPPDSPQPLSHLLYVRETVLCVFLGCRNTRISRYNENREDKVEHNRH